MVIITKPKNIGEGVITDWDIHQLKKFSSLGTVLDKKFVSKEG